MKISIIQTQYVIVVRCHFGGGYDVEGESGIFTIKNKPPPAVHFSNLDPSIVVTDWLVIFQRS